MTKARIASILTALTVLASAAVKVLNSDYDISTTEILLAISTITAAFGFQRS